MQFDVFCKTRELTAQDKRHPHGYTCGVEVVWWLVLLNVWERQESDQCTVITVRFQQKIPSQTWERDSCGRQICRTFLPSLCPQSSLLVRSKQSLLLNELLILYNGKYTPPYSLHSQSSLFIINFSPQEKTWKTGGMSHLPGGGETDRQHYPLLFILWIDYND